MFTFSSSSFPLSLLHSLLISLLTPSLPSSLHLFCCLPPSLSPHSFPLVLTLTILPSSPFSPPPHPCPLHLSSPLLITLLPSSSPFSPPPNTSPLLTILPSSPFSPPPNTSPLLTILPSSPFSPPLPSPLLITLLPSSSPFSPPHHPSPLLITLLPPSQLFPPHPSPLLLYLLPKHPSLPFTTMNDAGRQAGRQADPRPPNVYPGTSIFTDSNISIHKIFTESSTRRLSQKLDPLFGQRNTLFKLTYTTYPPTPPTNLHLLTTYPSTHLHHLPTYTFSPPIQVPTYTTYPPTPTPHQHSTTNTTYTTYTTYPPTPPTHLLPTYTTTTSDWINL
ncbi:hypothetical protein Pcinc_043238 [Petrolisthes cinctipes]|uniref:Uncharacterized protein n=1 Tax=Petrolisthes cinctipes TaxID=88211 RepID=A0AAE1BGC9_PETCI|nr:hypothetical protein Pcinc_043238 [Petrolisthes cinctipes]